jgi:hypothetical protein
MAITAQCFDQVPECYVLAIRGYEWELRQGLTALAQVNLARSMDAIWEALTHNPTRHHRAVGLGGR